MMQQPCWIQNLVQISISVLFEQKKVDITFLILQLIILLDNNFIFNGLKNVLHVFQIVHGLLKVDLLILLLFYKNELCLVKILISVFSYIYIYIY